MAGLYLLALAIGLVAASQIPRPSTEPSTYYADVAGSLVSGEGLVSHAPWMWSRTGTDATRADLLAPGVLGCLDGPPVPLEQTQTTAWLIRLSETCPAT